MCELDNSNIIDIITQSGLGGELESTGRKWRISLGSDGDHKYVVCNGDEGDPGAFMDRMLLESFPFRVIEGLIIAGYATKAAEGIFYIRAEYPLAVSRIRNALVQCYNKGILGDKVCGKDFSFNISFEGAGHSLREETALISSLGEARTLNASSLPCHKRF
jgi:NADH-quinone oxidoreductase subunit F